MLSRCDLSVDFLVSYLPREPLVISKRDDRLMVTAYNGRHNANNAVVYTGLDTKMRSSTITMSLAGDHATIFVDFKTNISLLVCFSKEK